MSGDSMKKIIMKKKEEVQEAYLKLQKEHLPIVIQNVLKEETKYKASLQVEVLINEEEDKIIPILIKNGFIKEGNNLIYVGKIPAKIINDNHLTLEEYLNDFNAVLYVNKKKGMTSFDVVNEISNIFGIKRVGHTGTLDPLAEGVMLVCIGKATKIVELLTAKDKEYIAEVQMGIKTDTLDITGNILEEKEVENNLKIKETLNHFKKTYLQEVPIYSAVKVHGKKLYEYARKNIEVELPKKEVTIKEIELLSSNNNTFKFKCLVTKGCYIRSLIKDIGEGLETLVTMKNLTRTKQGNISIMNTNTLEEIANNQFKYYKIEEVLDYPIISLNEEFVKEVSNGMKIPNNWNIQDKVIFMYNGKLLGIYQKDCNNLKVWKNFK